MPPSEPLHVGVFRHTLFLPSEPFIPLQAEALPDRVTYIARDRIEGGPAHAATATLAESHRAAPLRHTLGDPRPLERLLRQVRADIVHAHFGVEGSAARAACRRADLPLVTTLHGYDVSLSSRALVRSRKANWVRFALERRRFLSEADHLIAVSHHIAKRAVGLGAREEALRVLYTGVDLNAFTPSAMPDVPTVLHVARLVEKKGTSDLLDAFAQVARSIPEAQLRIIGDGPLRAKLEAQAKGLGIAKSVRFEGVRTHREVRVAMSESTVLCQPSVTAASGDQEGLPTVLGEAAASARPVVATRHGGIPEAVEHGATGYLVDEHDYRALADALLGLLGGSDFARTLGESARQRVERDFNATVQAQKLSNHLWSVVGRRR